MHSLFTAYALFLPLVRISSMLCPMGMKRHFLNTLRSIQRPVALMLTLLPLGSLVVTYFLVRWTGVMATQGSMGDPVIAEILRGFGTLFREYAMPVLYLTVGLAVLNVLSAFAARVRRPEIS